MILSKVLFHKMHFDKKNIGELVERCYSKDSLGFRLERSSVIAYFICVSFVLMLKPSQKPTLTFQYL